MSRNTTLHLEMVENAARFLTRALQATVPEAMRVARFSEDDIADPNIRKQILRRLPGRKKPMASLVSVVPVSSVACSPMTTLELDITNDKDLICPPPKRLRTRKTAPAAMRDRVEDLKQKRHFSTAHKEATRLFAQECAKPGGGDVNGAGDRAKNKNIVSDRVRKPFAGK
jgi:hypothetical protein